MKRGMWHGLTGGGGGDPIPPLSLRIIQGAVGLLEEGTGRGLVRMVTGDPQARRDRIDLVFIKKRVSPYLINNPLGEF